MRLWFSLLLLFFHLTSFAQIEQPSQHFDTKNGLPQIQVVTLFEDSRGYIWIGTKDGVARYNGETFKNFTTDDGLQSRLVAGICELPSGEILLMGRDGADIISGDVINPMPIPNSSSANWKGYNRNAEDTNGANMALPSGDQIFFITPSNYIQFRDSLVLRFSKIRFLTDTTFLAFTRLDKDNSTIDYFEVNDTVISRYDRRPSEYLYSKKNETDLLLMKYKSEGQIRNFSVTRNDSLLLKYEIDRNKGEFEQIEFNNNQNEPLFLQSNFLTKIIEVGPNTVQFHEYGSLVTDYLKDKNDNLWIGGERGIVIYSASPFKKFGGHEINDVWGVYRLPQDVLTTSYSEGAFITNIKTDKKRKINWGNTERPYYSIVSDSKKGVYFPMSGHGIMEFENNRTSQYYGPFDSTYRGLLLKKYNGGENQMLLGMLGKIGLFNSKNKSWESIESSTIERWAVGLASDTLGNIWVGTYRSLSKYKSDSKEWRSYFKQKDKHPMRGALSLDNDGQGSIWVGGLKGLYRIDIKSDSLIAVDTISFNKSISAIETIGDSMLVLGGAQDIVFFDLKNYYSNQQLKYKKYNRYNGFDGEGIAQSAFHLSGDTLWIPCSDGLYFLDINDMDFDNDIGNILITHINKTSVPYSFNQEVWKLDRNKNDIRIDYEAIGSDRTFQTQYSYQLEGVDEDWSDWTRDKFTIYQRLPSGDFTFHVRSKSNSNNYVTASMPIKISLDPWLHPSFYKYALFGILILGAGIIYQLYNRTKSKILLAEQEQRVNYLQIQTLQSQMNPHFMFNVLSAIQNNILSRDVKKANDHLVNLSTLIRRFLDASVKTNLDKGQLENSRISLTKEIELLKLYIEFEQLQYPDHFEYSIQVKSEKPNDEIHIPPLLLQPYVENAIKHGLLPMKGGGVLDISMEFNNEVLQVKIQDNGIGRKKAQEIQKQSDFRFKSHGTSLINKRIDILNEMGETISVKTDDNMPAGTIVLLKIKMK